MEKVHKVQASYRWAVLAMGTLAVFGALGLARWGYTMLLPSMQVSLGMDNGQAGLLATANLVGYLGFAVIGGALAARFGIRLVTALGLVFAGAGMLFTGWANDFVPVAVWRALTGLGSGAANVAVMGLWGAWFEKKKGFASGIAVSGSSIGLIFTGTFVPWLMAGYGETAWRTSWFVFGGITVILAIFTYAILRNNPADIEKGVGLKLSGEKQDLNQKSATPAENATWKNVYLSGSVWYLGLVYVAFGFSYIIYMTFFTKFLMSDYGYSTAAAGKLFMLMGWFSALSGVIWGTVSDSIGRKTTLIMLFLIHALAFGLFGMGSSPILFTISAVLFGLTAWSVPAIMAAACGDLLGSKLAPAALGFITLFFGIGQALGPVVGGAMADMTGSFSSAFLLAAVIALVGAGGSALLIKEGKKIEAKVVPESGQRPAV